MNKLRQTLREIWRLAIPYFRGPEKWFAIGLLALIVGLRLFNVWLDVRFNQWNNDFYTALQKKDWEVFAYQMFVVFSWIAALSIITGVYQSYFTQWLQIRWRSWMTSGYLDRWMNRGTHYCMRLLGNQADNPDQRVADDVQRFIGGGQGSGVLDIGVALLGQLVTLFSFLFILWNLSADSPLTIFGQSYVIPGYLVWTALIYAILGTALTHYFGRRLVPLNYDQQRFEADFRFNLVRLRENAEEVALLKGEAAEREGLGIRFARIIGNWYKLMILQKNLGFFVSGYTQIAIIFPFIVLSPLYFSGSQELGWVMQTAAAFGMVQGAFSFFVTAYTTLAEWKSVVDRLTGFEAAMADAERVAAEGPEISAAGASRDIAVDTLSVGLADGRGIARAEGLAIAPAERVLVTGPTGSGKSMLFRAIAGIWPFGKGKIAIPKDSKVLALPQQAYLPLGTLKAALTYPLPPESMDDAPVAAALADVGLSHLVERLNESDQWANQLSGGEQQRVGIARAILQKPDWLFLDEATAALDEESEARLYMLIRKLLPDTAIVSIGHRQTLKAFHDRFLTMRKEGGIHALVAVEKAAG
jgi:putative ATP-binding cassette transporter